MAKLAREPVVDSENSVLCCDFALKVSDFLGNLPEGQLLDVAKHHDLLLVFEIQAFINPFILQIRDVTGNLLS